MTSKMPNYVRKLLLKLLGVSDYMEELENNCNNALESISQLHKDKDVLTKELETELSNCNEELVNKKQELNNLNKYTSELELKLNQIKALVQ